MTNAIWYVNSGAAGSGSGTSWANACNTLANAIANTTGAGNDFYVANSHAEANTVTMTLNFKGTSLSPDRVFSCTTANSPATQFDLTPGANVGVVSAASLIINGSFYAYGLTLFNSGTSILLNANTVAGGSAEQIYDTCTLKNNSTVVNSYIKVNDNDNLANLLTRFSNCTVLLNGNTNYNIIWPDGGQVFFTGGSISGTLPSSFILFGAGIANQQYPAIVSMDGMDLSAISANTRTLVGTIIDGVYSFVNCRLGSNVAVANSPQLPGACIDLINCDSAATGYRYERYRFQGTAKANTTTYQTSPAGASDGHQTISWAVTTTANATLQSPFECVDIAEWVDTVGAQRTATIQLLANSTLLATDVWAECEYLSNSSYPIASLVSTAPSGTFMNQLSAANANSLANSSSIWANSLVNPVSQQLVINFTPQIPGIARFRVKVSKPSITLYIDPNVTIV